MEVNVVGFFRAEFGQGEAARRVVARAGSGRCPSLRSATTGYRTGSTTRSRPGRQGPVPLQRHLPERRAPAAVRPGRRRELLRGRYSAAGLWFWEGSRMPRELRPAIDLLDEMWVASDFVAPDDSGGDGQAGAHVPVAGRRAGTGDAHAQPTWASRRTLRLSLRVRLLQHDRAQEPARPDRGLHARVPGARRPLLYVKSINGDRARRPARVQTAIDGRPDIVLSDGYVSGEHLTSLTAPATATSRSTAARASA